MKIIPSIVTLLFLIAAGTVSSPAQNATTVEPLLVYKALQEKDCRHWVDSVMDKLSFKEKVGQLFIYTIAPVDTKRNLELLSRIHPNTILRGKTGIPRKRMASPHSPSKVIIKGTLACRCARFVSST